MAERRGLGQFLTIDFHLLVRAQPNPKSSVEPSERRDSRLVGRAMVGPLLAGPVGHGLAHLGPAQAVGLSEVYSSGVK